MPDLSTPSLEEVESQDLTGAGAPNSDFPADSFFDVFVVIETPIGPMFNKEPLLVVSRGITSFPPVAFYPHDSTSPSAVPLHSLADPSGPPVAFLTRAVHGTQPEQLIGVPVDDPGFEDAAIQLLVEELQPALEVPSVVGGTVIDINNNVITGSSVTLLRSDSSGGPFTAVPDGSEIMSPSNRANPDTIDSGGEFRWDVVAGFYVVRAEATGCVSPNDPNQTFVETGVLTIPPPISDLGLVLDCTVDVLPVDLSLTKIGSPNRVAAAGKVVYTLTVNNAGSVEAQNLVVTDTLPGGVTFMSTSGCAEDPIGVPTCSLGNIASGGSAQYTIEVTVDSTTSGTIANVATVSSNTIDPDTGNNTASATTTVGEEGPPIAVGGTATFLADSSSTLGRATGTIIGSLSSAFVVLAVGGWYARRRWFGK